METETIKTKKVTKPQPQIKTTESTNLKDYAALNLEVIKGKMPERKKVALMNKLKGLHAQKSLDDKEQQLFRMLLTTDRARGVLKDGDTFSLNEIEYNECELECYVKSKDIPAVYGIKYDTKCKYKHDTELGRLGVGHGKGRYVVYVPVIIPQEAQFNHKQALDKIEGREIDYSKVPPEKTIIKRFAFAEKEFNLWFGYDDEELLGNTSKDQAEYEF
jgi:hypothetical protein